VLKPFRGTQINRAHPHVLGLKGCWLFNEGVGNKIFDISGNNESAAIESGSGIVWAGANDGYCLDWGSAGDYGIIAGPSNATRFTSEDFTVVTKIYHVGSSQISYGRIINHGEYLQHGWVLNVDNSANKDAVSLSMEQSGAQQSVTTNTGFLNSNAWNTVAAVRIGTTAKIYNNGIEASSYPTYNTFIDPTITSHNLVIGTRPISTGQSWDGKIVWVYIYSRALAASEIMQLHLNPYAMFDYGINPALLYAAAAGGSIAVLRRRIEGY